MLISTDADAIATIMQQGGIIAYPTQAVFGLGCRADNKDAIQRLLNIKQRSADKGLILLAHNLKLFAPYILPLTPDQKDHIQNTTRATTWLVPTTSNISPLLTGKHNSIAIRITQHQATQQLCKKINHPITSTSANLSNQSPAINKQEIIQNFNHNLDGLYDHSIGNATKPSRIIDLMTMTVIRS